MPVVNVKLNIDRCLWCGKQLGIRAGEFCSNSHRTRWHNETKLLLRFSGMTTPGLPERLLHRRRWISDQMEKVLSRVVEMKAL